jgi:hypothetical protein
MESLSFHIFVGFKHVKIIQIILTTHYNTHINHVGLMKHIYCSPKPLCLHELP